MQLTPDGKHRTGTVAPASVPSSSSKAEDDESFFDLLSRCQSKRMDDQRCSLQLNSDNKENRNGINLPVPTSKNHNNNPTSNNTNNETPEDLLEMIVGMQSKRMDEQRVELSHLPGLQPNSLQRLEPASNAPDDEFLEMLMRCQVYKYF